MNKQIIKYGINGIAIFTMMAGAFGMLFCFIFLMSGGIEDVIGAGLPFVAGAVLFGAGLITLAIMNSGNEI